jgi:hypothetical protein
MYILNDITGKTDNILKLTVIKGIGLNWLGIGSTADILFAATYSA